MSRFDCILGCTAIAILTACSSPGSSNADGDELSPASKGQSVQSTTPGPSPGGPPGELVPLAVVPIEANAASAALGSSKVQAEILALALQIAAIHGVEKPTKIQAVAAPDHQFAEALMGGATIDDKAPVYMIKMTGGRFTATRHPDGVDPPQGNVLTVTLDAATLRVTEVGIQDGEPDLSKLGTIVDLSTQ